jgi:sulfite reductase (ferredoxin)
VLLKFHGTYQQDDRDQRAALAKEKKEKAWSFMVRSKMPGGRMAAQQYIIHDNLGDTLANGTLRLTNRQGIQFHGVLKGGLKEVISSINHSGLTTMGACGDVVRNTMSPAAPVKNSIVADTVKLSEEINERFLWRSSAYSDIWLDGEKVNLAAASDQSEGEEDPIYGRLYLPRKFKMGIAIQPENDVDVYSQDVGFVPYIVDGVVEGYTILVGGGFGMSHGQLSTRPFLGQALGYVKRAHVVDITEAIVRTQRDLGNREERKLARMKYLIQKLGIDAFREEVRARANGAAGAIEPAKPVRFETVEDRLGWHEQGDGNLYLAVHVSMGRIIDRQDGPQYRSAFRKLVETLGCSVVVTPNTNLIFTDIAPADREKVNALLAEHAVPHADGMTAARRVAHACVALPTCGLSLAESERVLPALLDRIDPILTELGLAQEPILIRMTGCPNGCGRPYNADIGLVGRAPGKYALFIGGSIRGDRLAGLEQKVVQFDDIPGVLRPLLEEYAQGRQPNERFTDFWSRTHDRGPEPVPEQFHIEFAERAAKLAGQKVTAAE